MDKELQVFSSEEFGDIRTVVMNDQPYFVGKDVAEKLGYERPTKAIADHVDKEDRDGIPIQDSIVRMQKTPIINESGLYSLILSSKLELAKRFKHREVWLLYQKYAGMGLTHTKTHTYFDYNGRERCSMQTYWTQKGRLFIYGLMMEDGNAPLVESEEKTA